VPAAGTDLPARVAALGRVLRSAPVRVGFMVVVLGLLAVALVDQGTVLREQVRELSLPVVALAFVAGVGGLCCSLMVWRSALADLGSRLRIRDAVGIMFIGQLAKYVPGSVWPVLAQMELGADHGVPRGRSAVSVVLSSGVMICTGGLVAVLTLPFAAGGAAGRYLWVVVVVPVGAALLYPPVLNRLLNRLLRLLRRPPLHQELSLRGIAVTTGWALLCWTLNGAMTYVLLDRLGGHGGEAALLAIGGYALAWVAGFLFVIAPAGAGIREAVLIAVLTTQLTTAAALTVALVSRALGVMADALAGAVAGALVGRRRLRALRSRAAGEAATGDVA
jgi:glycosyltransferase 2 family protein